jgi:23S rRNA pseudouridine1911/1915/1917 synthase
MRLLPPKVVFEDSSVMVIDKPSGWITNSASTTTDQPVIQKWLYDNFDYNIAKDDEYRSGIVHRLDKETSGVLIVAKEKSSFHHLQGQFKERVIEKSYIALVHGKLLPPEGVVKVSVGRLPWNRRRFGILPGGRESYTKYKVLENYVKGKEEYTLVEFFPKTGRTHQIRVHAKFLNHPIVADTFYAGRKTARKDRLWCPRLFLHAAKIAFNHPDKERRVLCESKLPEDLIYSLDALEKTYQNS